MFAASPTAYGEVISQNVGSTQSSGINLNAGTGDQGSIATQGFTTVSGGQLNAVQVQGHFVADDYRYWYVYVMKNDGSNACVSDLAYNTTPKGYQFPDEEVVMTFPFSNNQWGAGGCNLGAGQLYHIVVGYYNLSGVSSSNTSYMLGSNTDVYPGGSCGSVGACPGGLADLWFNVYTAGDEPPPDEYCPVTCIKTVTPANGAIVATSTSFTFGVTGFVTEADWNAGINGVRVQLDYQQSALAHFYSPAAVVSCDTGLIPNTQICGEYFWPVDAPGNFSFSTTTLLVDEIGRYTMVTDIEKSVLWVLTRNLTSTTTQFTVGTTTGLDKLVDATESAFNDLLSTTTVMSIKDTCTPLSGSFDISACLYGLIVPTIPQVQQVFTTFYDQTLVRAPFGYLTRFINIVIVNGLDTGGTMPPAMTYTFGSSSPSVLQGKSVSFQMWEHFDTLESIRTDDGQNKNIWDIVMPYFTTVVAFAVLLVMLEDLIGFRFMGDGTQVSETTGISTSHNQTTTVHADGTVDVGPDRINQSSWTNRVSRKRL